MGVYVIINLFAKDEPNAPDQIKAALLDARAVYLKDPGTVEWLPVQDSSNKRHFQVFEKFDSDNALQLHRNSAYRETFIGAIKDALDKPPELGTFLDLE